MVFRTSRRSLRLIPNNLKEWNYSNIKNLVEKGLFETEKFDFKERLPHKSDLKSKYRLEKTICAFANTNGGFLIYGIKDDKSLSTEKRIIGLDPSKDVPREIGDKIMKIEPFLHHDFKNPPIKIPKKDNVLHVIEIPRSKNKPHITSKGEFYHRTNKGNIKMSYAEIKESFIYESRRIEKINLLYEELLRNGTHAKESIIPEDEIKKTIPFLLFDIETLQLILIDIDRILENKELIKKLRHLKDEIKTVNEGIKLIQLRLFTSQKFTRKNHKDANSYFNIMLNIIIKKTDEVLKILIEEYGDLIHKIKS